jgi:hypothetical protein
MASQNSKPGMADHIVAAPKSTGLIAMRLPNRWPIGANFGCFGQLIDPIGADGETQTRTLWCGADLKTPRVATARR